MQIVELAYRARPRLSVASVKQRVEELLGEALDVQGDDASLSVSFWHRAHPVTYEDGKEKPPSTTLLHADQGCDPAGYASELQQSWACEGAGDLLAESTHSVLVTEMMASALPPADRLRLFHAVLRAVLEAAPPSAAIFKHAQQVVTPASYLETCDRPPLLRTGALNVRFFNVSNTGGDMLMDTRGMDEIGLHDLQCHFRDLDPNVVAGKLRSVAAYIGEKGPVIHSGETVDGHEPGATWVCQFENALVEPERELLDLNPGPPFAAGNR